MCLGGAINAVPTFPDIKCKCTKRILRFVNLRCHNVGGGPYFTAPLRSPREGMLQIGDFYQPAAGDFSSGSLTIPAALPTSDVCHSCKKFDRLIVFNVLEKLNESGLVVYSDNLPLNSVT